VHLFEAEPERSRTTPPPGTEGLVVLFGHRGLESPDSESGYISALSQLAAVMTEGRRMDPAAAADRLISAYNAQDFEAMEALIAPDIDFAHYNRGFAADSRTALLDVLRLFADQYLKWRRFDAPERITTSGDVCVRESTWIAEPKVDLEGLGAKADETFSMRLCSVMRFDNAGILLEWKDHG
jgi:hypothetical protein